MNKVVKIGVVIVIVAVVYLMLTIFMTLISGISQDTVAVMESSHNMTDYPGTSEAMGATPWVIWFIPGAIGIGAVVVILRSPTEE